MSQFLNKKLTIFIASIILATFPLLSVAVSPALNESQSLLNAATDAAGVENASMEPEEIVANFIQIALSFVGIVFMALILLGGWRWGSARGNEEQVTKAQQLIKEAVIGLIIVFGAYFVTAFVITRIGEASFEPLFPF